MYNLIMGTVALTPAAPATASITINNVYLKHALTGATLATLTATGQTITAGTVDPGLLDSNLVTLVVDTTIAGIVWSAPADALQWTILARKTTDAAGTGTIPFAITFPGWNPDAGPSTPNLSTTGDARITNTDFTKTNGTAYANATRNWAYGPRAAPGASADPPAVPFAANEIGFWPDATSGAGSVFCPSLVDTFAPGGNTAVFEIFVLASVAGAFPTSPTWTFTWNIA